jgi:hypothetical protein
MAPPASSSSSSSFFSSFFFSAGAAADAAAVAPTGAATALLPPELTSKSAMLSFLRELAKTTGQYASTSILAAESTFFRFSLYINLTVTCSPSSCRINAA